MKKILALVMRLLAVILIPVLISCGSESNKPAGQILAEVDVALPVKKKIVEWDEYTGRFQAVEEVDVRARVTGYLEAIKFQDGQTVKKGDVLFVIDQRPFKYALARAEAQYALAKAQYERAIKLQKEKFISAEVIDQRFQDVQVAETRVQEAKLNLEFTEIKAPISGKISRDFVSVGNLIRMNDTVLTKVVSVDPIYFYFETSQNDLLKYIRLDRAGKRLSSEKKPTPVLIKLPDEKDYLHQGEVDFLDNVIDSGTGTILARALVPNPDNVIYPGLFARVKLVGSGEYEAILLPDKAINTDQARKFVYVVDNENKVKRVYVELGPLRESGFYIIRSGLKGDEKVIIHGIQRIHGPNQEVKPVVIEVTEN
ncbi:TPA: efflux RND transporter periplasmic adaptor subunit [Legionella pneumophila subsp. pneumophila]|uniref:efflux RND transporter periplasmic adaptor subunit n=1 Tax=Legionella pneumophila TaxID=446 RepID=UPI000770AEB2|nr:efflux RND transporter periplasmic adaptor subunit [Legionella pneumophila]HAT8849491.1 efflux RND transporter periplasmic adaptor subunit [Legionella pneumophila subsp. pneumophila]MDX1794371.1 efflux RND transporter periplasmic adaptor subunit [Legionella pneumophila]CZI36997.1 Efflux pump periplasmic linker BepF [Legionella pneumophila]CZI61903.1 Efflux pump periplasmic linker BepF [Legionella pneumophila]HAT1966651.1 efflux RND transporter periplasmic adaptor subunit [Legionella pneumop